MSLNNVEEKIKNLEIDAISEKIKKGIYNFEALRIVRSF